MTLVQKDIFCSKTGINNFFGTFKKVEWISSTDLDKDREAEIGSCFLCEIEFHYSKNKNI